MSSHIITSVFKEFEKVEIFLDTLITSISLYFQNLIHFFLKSIISNAIMQFNCHENWSTLYGMLTLTICVLGTLKTGTLAKSEDPDEMHHKAAFHQGLPIFTH